jgi:hypothetical protein
MSEIEAKASRIAAANPELYLPWSFVQLLPAQVDELSAVWREMVAREAGPTGWASRFRFVP